MDPAYGKHYSDLYHHHWWWRAREEALLAVLRRRTPAGRTLRILDVGCGNGLFFDQLSAFGDIEGVEPDKDLVDPAGKYSQQIRRVPFDDTFLAEQPYDLVLMLDVLEHLDEPDRVLRRVYSLLGSGGTLLLTVPAFLTLWTNHDTINRHRVRYRRDTLFPLLQRAGFSVAESRYWYQWLAPVKLAVHIAEGIVPREPSVPKVPPRWVNRLLYYVSRIEQRTLGSTGIPFGSSLMVYCVKQAPASATQAIDPVDSLVRPLEHQR